MTILEKTQQTVTGILTDALTACQDAGDFSCETLPAISLEAPREKAFGEYATNVAMLLAKQAHMNPRAIAEKIVARMQTAGTIVTAAEVAGAGFINFRLDPAYIQAVLVDIETQGEAFGRVDVGAGQKIMVEFVSANPTGPMHRGNARGGALGDCLASVLDWAGYDVTREFYVNDAGNQIEKFALSLEARYIQELQGEDAVPFPEDGYQGEDIRQHARDFIAQHGDILLSADSRARKDTLVAFALQRNMEGLKRDLEKYRIHYDVWFLESSLHESGAARAVVDELTQRGYTYEKEGAIWFRATDFGEEKDDVLVRANGFLTYFAVDIAYHRNKFLERNFDTVINVWGADHHGHVSRLKAAMAALGIDPARLEILLMQLVRLMRGGEVARMSKRTGKAITLSDLLDETSVDAARFYFNMRQPNAHFDFDLDLAVEQSNENPVFYVQYAHARICSIIRLLAADGVTVPKTADVDLSLLSAPQEIDLLKLLAEFPEEIKRAAAMREPSRITRYVMDLAAAFHTFYNACRVNTEDAALRAARLKLVDGTRTVLKNALTVLSIDAPEQM